MPTAQAAQNAPLVRIRSLHKYYDRHEVRKGIDLDVAPGEVIALVGRNVMLAPSLVQRRDLRAGEAQAREGMTLLMVTHEMGFARKVADRVVFMHAGRIHEMGPPETLFSAPQTPELQQFLSALH